jgi:hypothetical protein
MPIHKTPQGERYSSTCFIDVNRLEKNWKLVKKRRRPANVFASSLGNQSAVSKPIKVTIEPQCAPSQRRENYHRPIETCATSFNVFATGVAAPTLDIQ